MPDKGAYGYQREALAPHGIARGWAVARTIDGTSWGWSAYTESESLSGTSPTRELAQRDAEAALKDLECEAGSAA